MNSYIERKTAAGTFYEIEMIDGSNTPPPSEIYAVKVNLTGSESAEEVQNIIEKLL